MTHTCVSRVGLYIVDRGKDLFEVWRGLHRDCVDLRNGVGQRGVKNLQEDAVRRKFEELKHTMPEFCGCDMCCDDVLVYALNRLSPRYVAQPTGEVITNVSLGSDQPKADMSVVILDGMRRVHAEPRAGHPAQ